MKSLVKENIINDQQQSKIVKKSYVSQPITKKAEEAVHKTLPHHESEMCAAWCDEHVLDDFRW